MNNHFYNHYYIDEYFLLINNHRRFQKSRLMYNYGALCRRLLEENRANFEIISNQF
jgi:hypothetical protein